jgi:hypothetical protein
MSIRIEIQPDGKIEIQRHHPAEKKSNFITCESLDGALRVIRFLIKRDLDRAERVKFMSQSVKEARQALKILSKRSPYDVSKKTK